jgi:hypothetical protein
VLCEARSVWGRGFTYHASTTTIIIITYYIISFFLLCASNRQLYIGFVKYRYGHEQCVSLGNELTLYRNMLVVLFDVDAVSG